MKKEKLIAFLNGKCYVVLLFFMILVCHACNIEWISGYCMMISFFLGCLLCKDLRFSLPTFFGFIFQVTVRHTPNVPSYSDYYLQPTSLLLEIPLIALLLIGLILFILRNRLQANKITFRSLLPSLILLSVAIVCNGILYTNHTLSDFLYGVSFPVIFIGFYLLFHCFYPITKESKTHLMFVILFVGLLVFFQLLLAFLYQIQMEDGKIVKESVVLGWGTWVAIGFMQAFSIPSAFYLATTQKKPLFYYLSGCLLMLGAMLSQSRGSLLIALLLFLPSVVMSCFWGKNKKINRITTLVVFLFGVAIIVLFSSKIKGILQNFLDYGFSDNGRLELWKQAVKQFAKAPLFGTGFYDTGMVHEWIINVYPHFYHNTFLQMLGACGAFGILAYLIHRIQSFVSLFKKASLFRFSLFLSILSVLLSSQIDVMFFITYPTAFYTILSAIAESEAKTVIQTDL